MLMVGGGVLWAFNHGPTPERWLASLTAALTEQLGAEVSIEAVRLAGVDRITLHGVRIEGEVPVEARRVVAAFSVGELWRKRATPVAALRWVSVDGWNVALPAETLHPLEWLRSLLAADVAGVAPGDAAERVGSGDDERTPSELELHTFAAWMEALLGHEWVDGTLDVYLRGGRIAFESAGDRNGVAMRTGDLPAELHVNGALALGKEQLVVRNVRVGIDDWQATVNGAALPRPDLYVHVAGSMSDETEHAGDDSASVFAPSSASVSNLPSGLARMSWPLPFRISGTVQSEVWLTGRWDAPDAWGRGHVRTAVIAPVGAVAEYSADDVGFEWTYRPGRGVGVTLDATRGGARLHMQGEIAGDGSLAMDVVGTNVRVPDDVPPLERWDLSGQVDFSGTLQGTLSEPVLRADVVADGGYLFGQPFSGLQGYIGLTEDEFSFERVRVIQGTAAYYLDGAMAFTEPTQLDLTLMTDNGRAETLTAVLGWDVPLQSGLAGTLQFSGPLGDIAAYGELELHRGSAWEQPFDSVTGRFQYGGGSFAVTDVTGTVRGGTFTASGGSTAPTDAGGWQFDVVLADVPIQAAPLLRERLPMVSGVLDFVGTVSNDDSEWNPRLAGSVAGRHLFIGSFDFVDAEGRIEWNDGSLSTTGLTLQRRSGGVYDVTGHVHDVLDAARLDIAIGVNGESVGQLLAVTDWRLPLLAHSDPLRAEVLLHGTPEQPEASIRVETDAVYVVGQPVPLALDLRLKDGRIEVEQLGEPTGRT